MKKKIRSLTDCKTDSERAAYFTRHNSLDLIEQGLLEELPVIQYQQRPKKNLQLNIRVDAETLEQLKGIALKRKLGYHTLARMFLQEKIQENSQKI